MKLKIIIEDVDVSDNKLELLLALLAGKDVEVQKNEPVNDGVNLDDLPSKPVKVSPVKKKPKRQRQKSRKPSDHEGDLLLVKFGTKRWEHMFPRLVTSDHEGERHVDQRRVAHLCQRRHARVDSLARRDEAWRVARALPRHHRARHDAQAVSYAPRA